MARVIKAGAGQKAARPATRVHVDAGPKRVIARDVYQAKQDAEHILMRAEQERQALIVDGKKQAARAREEAMARGASEAFAAAASEALTAFRKRAERYAEASDDVRVLALEVVKKVLGAEADLSPTVVDKLLQRGMAQLRARRRLRLQVSHKRLGELASERPNLMKALQSEPDLVVEGVDDVSTGFARVVTEIGGALCAEDTALDALSMAVNVREQPRERAGRAATGGNTAVGDGPSGLEQLRRKHSTDESIPDAAVEEVDDEHDEHDEEDEVDDTINLPASIARAVAAGSDDVEEISAEEDHDATHARPRAPALLRKPAIGTQRPATRAVPMPPEDDAATRRTAVIERGKDEDLDLFTDDAPRKRR